MSEKSVDKIFKDLNIVDIEQSDIKILHKNSRKIKSILSFKEQKKLKSIVNSNNIPYLNRISSSKFETIISEIKLKRR
ncbi:MAG: hypothetical protein HS049_01290 [Thaumarchaeota archaeon]|nr:hypothetical protein [Nitrososphaerota archaeon]|tara:strand:- start:472 stop:705 length:234 start_codon:yes stop_codon:yes gene_type:complete